jgi:hypothetical protein
MVLTGVWTDKYRYKVTDPTSGESEVVTIMGTDGEMADSVFMEELAHYARERVVADWKKEKPKPHTPDQRRELGQTLKEIGKAHRYWAENLHSRYWRGI